MNEPTPTRNPIDWKKYLLVFGITVVIFGAGIYINNLLDQQRIGDIKGVQDQISLDLLSSETQFDLINDTSCKNVGDGSVLSPELNSLANELSYMEANSSTQNAAELLYLKKYYSLLEIKDYILMTQVSQKCGSASQPISILYFYGEKTDCPECEKMGYVLTYLREQYPTLRIYSFDDNLSISAIDTLKSLYKVDEHALPALVIGDDTYVGFRDIDQVKALIPQLKVLDAEQSASSTATSTGATSTKSQK